MSKFGGCLYAGYVSEIALAGDEAGRVWCVVFASETLAMAKDEAGRFDQYVRKVVC